VTKYPDIIYNHGDTDYDEFLCQPQGHELVVDPKTKVSITLN